MWRPPKALKITFAVSLLIYAVLALLFSSHVESYESDCVYGFCTGQTKSEIAKFVETDFDMPYEDIFAEGQRTDGDMALDNVSGNVNFHVIEHYDHWVIILPREDIWKERLRLFFEDGHLVKIKIESRGPFYIGFIWHED